MNLNKVTQADIDTYNADGVVCLRNVIDKHWIEKLQEAWSLIETRIQGPEPYYDLPQDWLEADPLLKAEVGSLNGPDGAPVGVKPGFTSVKWAFWWNRALQDFVHNSPAAKIAGELMSTERVRFFWDQMFVKESATNIPTYWHTDQPTWPIDSNQIPSMWIPLTPVDRKLSSLEYILGSHKTYDETHWPRSFNASQSDMPKGRQPFTDYELRRGDGETRFEAFDMEPGDLVMFSSKLYHGAGPNIHPSQDRIAISLRWMGDDAKWDPRPECVNLPGIPMSEMTRGKSIENETIFPTVWEHNA